VDWVAVAPYIYPEPSVTIGAQTARYSTGYTNSNPRAQTDLSQLLLFLTTSSNTDSDITQAIISDYREVDESMTYSETITGTDSVGPYKYGTAKWGLAKYA
jgi:hypothetical protein